MKEVKIDMRFRAGKGAPRRPASFEVGLIVSLTLAHMHVVRTRNKLKGGFDIWADVLSLIFSDESCRRGSIPLVVCMV